GLLRGREGGGGALHGARGLLPGLLGRDRLRDPLLGEAVGEAGLVHGPVLDLLLCGGALGGGQDCGAGCLGSRESARGEGPVRLSGELRRVLLGLDPAAQCFTQGGRGTGTRSAGAAASSDRLVLATRLDEAFPV